jgi:RNA polymerase sigma-70 factor (ECF subfamily)
MLTRASSLRGAISVDETRSEQRFDSFVREHRDRAIGLAWRLLDGDKAAAEDVAQEAFVRAYKQMHRFREDAPFRPWLLRIVQNLALNELRARQRRGGLIERVGVLSPRVADAPDAQVAAADESERVLRAMDELPPDDRTVLHLRYFLELPEREIAEAIGRPAGTVKSRLHRASQRLRDVIERKYPELREPAE